MAICDRKRRTELEPHCAVLYEKKAKLALGLWLVPSPRYFAKLLKCRIRGRIAGTGSIETNHARLIRAEPTLAALPNNTGKTSRGVSHVTCASRRHDEGIAALGSLGQN